MSSLPPPVSWSQYLGPYSVLVVKWDAPPWVDGFTVYLIYVTHEDGTTDPPQQRVHPITNKTIFGIPGEAIYVKVVAFNGQGDPSEALAKDFLMPALAQSNTRS